MNWIIKQRVLESFCRWHKTGKVLCWRTRSHFRMTLQTWKNNLQTSSWNSVEIRRCDTYSWLNHSSPSEKDLIFLFDSTILYEKVTLPLARTYRSVASKMSEVSLLNSALSESLLKHCIPLGEWCFKEDLDPLEAEQRHHRWSEA